jgi:hypothetical protein
MLRLTSLAVLTLAALAAAPLAADLALARSSYRFGIQSAPPSSGAATTVTTVGALKTQRLLSQTQQSDTAISNAAKTTGSASGGIVRKCPTC